MRPRYLLIPGVGIAGLVLAVAGVTAATSPLSDEAQLGKAIFFDQSLSLNENQACASCHGPEVGFTGPLSDTNAHGAVYEGSVPLAFGNRKPPSAAYAAVSPVLHLDKTGTGVGGNFWNGRATGDKLGNPAADQAQFPFVNPAEQALPDSACVVQRVCAATDYPVSFESVFGAEACDIAWPDDIDDVCATPGATVGLSDADRARSDAAYDEIALAIADYEASDEVTAFSSKYDQSFTGDAKLTQLERRGFALFQGKGGCKACHPSGKDALFTDFTFDNLGVPVNPENPAFIADGFVDEGLGGYLRTVPGADWEDELGKQKVPTLRNVDLRPSEDFVKAYGHNGYFKSLEGIVHFYNTRDVLPTCAGNYTEAQALAANCWPAPEVAANVNHDELGDLGLSADEEAAIVAFLRTLSDGYGQ
jgi:cytochrome c peroxidase